MITALYYRLLPLLVLLAGYNSVYAMHTLARTDALRKVLARTYAHASRRFYATDRIHNGFRLSSTNNQSSDKQSHSQEQQSKEQRYQTFRNRLYATGVTVAGASINSDDKEDKDRALFHALTTGNEETIKTLLENNNFSDDYLQKLLKYAVEHNNYVLFSAVLDILDRKNLGDTIQASYTIPKNLQELWNNVREVPYIEQLRSAHDVHISELKNALLAITELKYNHDNKQDRQKHNEFKQLSYRQIYDLTRDQLKEAIIKAYKEHENLNIKLEHGRSLCRSLLHSIVLLQDYELMSLLIKAGANPNVRESSFWQETVLFHVQSPVIARFLINAGARTDVQNRYHDDTPAHQALRNGNIALAQVLLSPEVATIKNRDGKTPLQILCDECATLSLNSQPNTFDLLDQLTQDKHILSQAQSELTQRMRNQNTQDCVLLALVLEDLTKNPTKTASELWRHHISQARFLKADFSDTLVCNKQDHYLKHRQTIQDFIQAGHDVNMPVTSGDSTLLHIAIYFNDLEMAQQLIQHGASVHTSSAYGKTPLFHARTYTAYEFLKKQGALLTVKDSANYSLLYYAMQHGYDPRLVSEYAHLEQDNPAQAWQYLIAACKDSTPQELMAKVQAYLAAAPTSLKNSDITTKNYRFNSVTENNCFTLVEILKKLAQQTTP